MSQVRAAKRYPPSGGGEIGIRLVGASCRAIAFSACRSGFAPRVLDQFDDLDVRPYSAAHRFDNRSAFLEEEPSTPWLYAGGFEGRAHELQALATTAPLWGNPAAVVRAVRDPFRLRAVLRDAGFRTPALRSFDAPPAATEHQRWLVKTRGGGGGAGVRWTKPRVGRHRQAGDSPDGTVDTLDDDASYFQEYTRGVAASALFLGYADRCLYLGSTRQLIGCGWLGAAEFSWCGNIAPLRRDQRSSDPLRRAGDALRREFGLRGLFGMDYLECGEHRELVPIEVNPRYTGSTELLERLLDAPLLRWHAAAFDDAFETAPSQSSIDQALAASEDVALGKAILFAPQDVKIDEAHVHGLLGTPETIPPSATKSIRGADDVAESLVTADIPAPATFVRRHAPLLTLFAQADDPVDCEHRLREHAARLRQRFVSKAEA